MLIKTKRLFGVISLTLLVLTSCAIGNRTASNGHNAITTMGNIDVNANNTAGHLEVTNGNINISHHARVKSVEVLNGNIMIDDYSQAGSLTTTNGNIDIGENVNIDNSINSLNGNIRIAQRSIIGRNVNTTTGDVFIGNGVIIKGDIIFKKPGYWSSKIEQEKPVLEIKQSAVVEGNIHLYRSIELRLPEDFPSEKIIRYGNKRS